MKHFFLILVCSLYFFIGCTSSPKFTETQIAQESKKANAFFETKFQEEVQESPVYLTMLGQKERYDELGDYTYEFHLKRVEAAKKTLKELKKINYMSLNEDTQLSYRLFEENLKDTIKSPQFFFNTYFVTQMFGIHSFLPSFMINNHKVESLSDAEAYIKRLWAFNRVFSETLDQIKKQKNIEYPKFIFDKVISDSENLISGRPFETLSQKDSVLYKDFKDKVNKLKIRRSLKKVLLHKARHALNYSVQTGYKKIIARMKSMKSNATEPKGVWAQPNGKAYYSKRLKDMTTTNKSPKEIHNLGLKEVKRLQNEMLDVAKKLKFEGGLLAFFEHIKSQKKLFYPNTKSGKKAYLRDAKKIIKTMKSRLDELFLTKPKADLIVKAVEPFREKSAGIAFYQSPALNGSRPGIYYVNLSDMSSVAKYDMEALAYHEALPGHHMQLAIAQEIKDIPTFRKVGRYTAYSEGWGLYSELVPKEIGMYQDPYSDFGRLSMELWRAARLVVDTGVHYHKWSYEKAISYLQNNTPNSQDEITKGIQRYFVNPGQATAYKMGQLKILGLRAKAKQRLGDKFDLRRFHDAVLTKGALPLYELEKQIDLWIKKEL